MSKKQKKAKKAPAPQKFLTAEEYLQTRIRTLPICRAYMTPIEDFKRTGNASTATRNTRRRHFSGNLTAKGC